jgi:toxin ParE1/3/4
MQDLLRTISRDRPEAARKLIERIRKTCRLLARAPGMGTSRDDIAPSLRCFSVGNYVIYFRSARDGIQVLRIVHGAQDEEQFFLTES